ncbi:MAG: hypothetical protein ACRDPG_04920 [Nocardioidaceae bacterium]
MYTYTVSLVVQNVELTDEVTGSLFSGIEDVVASSIGGVVKVTAPVSAPDDETAALRLIDQVAEVLPDAVAVRLDQDLVSITDIAERTRRTRESVRLLVEGKRGPGGFPSPVGIVGDSIRVWPWSVILEWFRDSLDEDLGERGLSPAAAALVDACLADNRQSRFGLLRAVAFRARPGSAIQDRSYGLGLGMVAMMRHPIDPPAAHARQDAAGAETGPLEPLAPRKRVPKSGAKEAGSPKRKPRR